MREAVLRPVDLSLGWLKARERKVLLMTAAAQLLIVVAMIGLRALPLVTGQTVLVRVVPIDPRDFFRGDYVTLSYDFSRVPPEGVEGISADERGSRSKLEGRTVYVPLVSDSDGVHMRAGKPTVVKPAGLFLKGQMRSYGSMEFGIEAYYVQEGTGHRYEQAIRNKQLSAELAVTSNGHAALRGLRMEQERR
ncbi:MAG TPA: GDYXXLXY domain-containing protein [Gemmatimonadales bacterium]|nr:GDYXXLXY domain-containing protein [Gemmatimonadales bacterium]